MTAKRTFKPRMTFWVTTRSDTHTQPLPKFAAVVAQLYAQYSKRRGNIIGTTLTAPDGATTRQISLALNRVRERWAKERTR